jgi:hypothetical protein
MTVCNNCSLQPFLVQELSHAPATILTTSFVCFTVVKGLTSTTLLLCVTPDDVPE